MSKINELGLYIDTDKMYNDLISEFIYAIDRVSDDLMAQMKSRTNDPVVQSSIKKKIMMDSLTEIEIAVGSDHWKAFLDNYGTGSLMADQSENPHLDNYKGSKFWNEFRTIGDGKSVRGRSMGAYIVPDWESGDGYVTRKSSGTLAGVNLETTSTKNNKYAFTPQKPTFFLEHSMEFIKPILKEKLNEVYEHFPFHKYIKGGI